MKFFQKKIKIFALIFIPLITLFAQNKSYNSIAIMPFKISSANRSFDWLGNYFTDGLILELSKYPTLKVVERQYLNQIIEELKLDLSGITKNSVEIGKLVGASVYIFGNISVFNDTIILNTRIVSVETAEILGAVEKIAPISKIIELQKQISYEIATKIEIVSIISSHNRKNTFEFSVDLYKNYIDINNYLAKLPILGLDPARKRKSIEYQSYIERINKLLDQIPSLPELYLLRGMLNAQLENFTLAEKDITIASNLEFKPENLNYVMGDFYYITKNYQKAEKYFSAYTQNHQNDSKGWYALGKTYLKMRKNKQAAKVLLISTLKNPFIKEAESTLRTILISKNFESIINYLTTVDKNLAILGEIYFYYWQNDFKKVFEILADDGRSITDSYLVQYLLGLKFSKEKSFLKAESYFKKSLKLNPKFPLVHRELGKILIKTKRKDLGVKHLQIYLLTSSYIKDFEEIKHLID